MQGTTDLVAILPVHTSTGLIAPGTHFRARINDAEMYQHMGQAIPQADYHPLRWRKLDWRDKEVAILASGESLSLEQVDAVNHWKKQNTQGRAVVAINTTFRRAPFADILYACDHPWWKIYYAEAVKSCFSQFWTQDPEAVKDFGLQHIPSKRGEGLCTEDGIIYQGENGGYQAIGLCYQAGVRRMYLLGYDMQGGHWHGEHPDGLNKPNPFPRWLKFFDKLSVDCKAQGLEIFNCTSSTAMRSFLRLDWKEVFV